LSCEDEEHSLDEFSTWKYGITRPISSARSRQIQSETLYSGDCIIFKVMCYGGYVSQF